MQSILRNRLAKANKRMVTSRQNYNLLVINQIALNSRFPKILTLKHSQHNYIKTSMRAKIISTFLTELKHHVDPKRKFHSSIETMRKYRTRMMADRTVISELIVIIIVCLEPLPGRILRGLAVMTEKQVLLEGKIRKLICLQIMP